MSESTAERMSDADADYMMAHCLAFAATIISLGLISVDDITDSEWNTIAEETAEATSNILADPLWAECMADEGSECG